MINVAIIGTGGISIQHIEGYLKFPERCRIVALSDRFPERAEDVKRKYGLACAVHADPERLAKDGDCDIVSICTPPSTHAPLALACLGSGKHVLLEKPMAASLEECDAMLAAAGASGKILSVVAQNRFRTPAMRLKRIVASGLLGELKHIQVHSYWWRALAYYDLDWRGAWASEGGGCTLNHSVHHIDLMLWLMGGMPYEILSLVDNLSHGNSEVEDISMSFLRFRPHILGQLTSSLVHHGEDQSITVQAEKASVAMPWKAMAMKARTDGFPEGDDTELIAELNAMYEAIPALAYERHAGQIDDVLAAIENGTAPLVSGQDGKNAINVILGVYKSAFEKRAVTLPLDTEDAYYTRDGVLSHVRKFHEKTKSVTGFPS